jgi:CheY-like chemotaxis protein
VLEAREVLLVDALEVRWVPLRRMLESQGALVHVVDHLAKAREAVVHILPALMCIEAEEGHFSEWLRERLKDPLLRAIPIVALSGGVVTEERKRLHEEWRSLGVSDVLNRPHRVSQVLQVCASKLNEQERYILPEGEKGHLLLNAALTGLTELELELTLPLPFPLDQKLELEAQCLEPLGLKSMMIHWMGSAQTPASAKRARLIGDFRKISHRMELLWNWKHT